MWLHLEWLIPVLSGLLGIPATFYTIPKLRDMFIRKGISGKDMSKNYTNIPNHRIPQVPEAQGVITGGFFLMLTITMIPLGWLLLDILGLGSLKISDLPFSEVIQLLQLFAAIISICCMLLLGFADDVLDLKWRHKIFLPTIASVPILVVYYMTSNKTDIVLPLILRPFLDSPVHLGILYYVYMGMLAIFCTNAINILAGINGLEVGQSVIIAITIMIFNLREMNGLLGDYHKFSLYFLCPYVATSLPLLWYNWYPSKVFPGDTFCYYSGMTFAVVAILGHFSKTLILFFIPQVVNFIYSAPQLFHLLPCPRHRLPKYNAQTDNVSMSLATLKKSELKGMGAFVIKLAKLFGVIYVNEFLKDDVLYIEFNNLTLINLFLKIFGPLHEKTLTTRLLIFQIFCSCVAFGIRYPLALLFYGEIVA